MGRRGRDWNKVREEYIKSGMTRREYAESIGMPLSWLNRGLNTLEKEEAGSPRPEPEGDREFIAVKVKDPVPSSGHTITIKAGKLMIEMPAYADGETLYRVFMAAGKIC